eukprot:gene12662-biopygen10331
MSACRRGDRTTYMAAKAVWRRGDVATWLRGGAVPWRRGGVAAWRRVPMSRCPDVLMSWWYLVGLCNVSPQGIPCANVPMSQCPNVPMSGCPDVPMS